MQVVSLPGTHLAVSRFCFGAGAFGTGVMGDKADRLLAAFVEAGGNFFDTAHCYAFWAPGGLGASERELAASLRRIGAWNGAVVATRRPPGLRAGLPAAGRFPRRECGEFGHRGEPGPPRNGPYQSLLPAPRRRPYTRRRDRRDAQPPDRARQRFTRSAQATGRSPEWRRPTRMRRATACTASSFRRSSGAYSCQTGW